jgi:type I restriction enzyme S subunit
MSPDLKRIVESKVAFRRQLADKPVAEKLRIVEELAERSLATRKDTSAPLPDEPWQIPQSWRWSRMGDVGTIIGGSTPRTDRAEYFGGDIPWVTPADLSKYNAKTISRGARNITKEGLENSGARLLPAGTVLFSSRAPIGYVAIAANPVATNQGFKSFVLGDELLPDFVYYYLQRAKEFAVALASGTTFLEISGKNAARLPIPIPALDEQRQIVAEIEKQFTRLEAGVAALRRVQANLKRYRAAVLKAACEGRLVPTEAELQQLEGRGQKSKAKFETGEVLLARILPPHPTHPTFRSFPKAGLGCSSDIWGKTHLTRCKPDLSEHSCTTPSSRKPASRSLP